jgi:hypothetical protein
MWRRWLITLLLLLAAVRVSAQTAALPYDTGVTESFTSAAGVRDWRFPVEAGVPLRLLIETKGALELRLTGAGVDLVLQRGVLAITPTEDGEYTLRARLLSGSLAEVALYLTRTDRTPTPLPTDTVTPTFTPTPTSTFTPTPTVTPSATPTPTETPTPTPTFTPTLPPGYLSELSATAGQIAPAGVARYFFTGALDGRVTLAAVPRDGTGLRPRLELYTPAGELLYTALGDVNTDGAAVLPDIRLPEAGTYSVLVSGERGTSGDFLVQFSRRALRLLTLSETIVPGQYNLYRFYAPNGQQLRIRVESFDGVFDPVAALIDPTGAVAAEGDDSPGSLNPDFGLLTSLTGTYTLRVNGYGMSGGAVAISVELLL